MADYAQYRADRRGGRVRTPLAPNSVIAGDPRFVQFATILEDQRPLSGYAARLSPYVDDASWDERIALNAYLLGLGVSGFEADQRLRPGGRPAGAPGPATPSERDALLASGARPSARSRPTAGPR